MILGQERPVIPVDKPVKPALYKEDSRTLIVTCNFHVHLCALDYLSASIVPFSYKFQLHFLCGFSTFFAMPLFVMMLFLRVALRMQNR